ncbi:MAG: hypothetical protein HWE10_15635 [Gammaproteobacteria bacterium]|nr:hypothetical protein [Gammaproteobacteria bacterium]
MNNLLSQLKILTFIFASAFLVACTEGKMEQAGEAADEAVTDAKNKVEDVCEEVKEELKTKDQDC